MSPLFLFSLFSWMYFGAQCQRLIRMNNISHNYKANTSKSKIEFIELSYNNDQYEIRGYQPQTNDPDGYPLYVFITGTGMYFWDDTCQTYAEYMAQNGFIAVSINYAVNSYPITCTQFIPGSFLSKARLLWDMNRAQSALSILCDPNNLAKVNCNKGILTSGLSQGGQLALLSAVYGAQITAMYIMGAGDRYPCLTYNALNIDQSRIRSMVGEDDQYFGGNLNGVRLQQQNITGYICDEGTTDCIQSDESGWYIVQKTQTGNEQANHCYAYNTDGFCDYVNNEWNPSYLDPSNGAWTFDANLNWLIQRQLLK